MENKYNRFNLKILNSMEEIEKTLLGNSFSKVEVEKLSESYYTEDNYNLNETKSLKDLDEYFILRKNENDLTELLLYTHGDFTGKYRGDFSIERLNQSGKKYKEIFSVNKEVTKYTKDDINFNIVNVENLGIFFEYISEEEINVDFVYELLNNLNINYNETEKNYAEIKFQQIKKGD